MTAAPAIIRRSKTDRIGTMLKQQTGGNTILKYGSEFQEPDLPQREPGILPSPIGDIDVPPVGPSDLPSGQVVAYGPGNDVLPANYPVSGTGGGQEGQGVGFNPVGGLSAIGPFPGGNMGGPHGSIYGTNPVTGNPIYNVNGVPGPGFFDSTLGKFTKGVGTGVLNAFVPGAGFVAGKVLDAARRANDRRNTGTDLSGSQPGSQTSQPSGPAWFQRGYQLPSGIQEAIARGDYSRAYGPTQNSIDAGKIMSSQAAHGIPNSMRSFAANGRFLIDEEGTPTMQGPTYGKRLTRQFRMPQGGPAPRVGNTDAVNEWLMQQPAYIKFMQGKGG